MKRLILLTLMTLTAIGLLGCEQTMFGVPKDQWNQLTPQQQSQVIEAYNQRQQIEAQNAPVMAAIGAASSILKPKNSNTFDINN